MSKQTKSNKSLLRSFEIVQKKTDQDALVVYDYIYIYTHMLILIVLAKREETSIIVVFIGNTLIGV